MGHWNILDSMVGEGIGVTELIDDVVKPLLVDRYKGNPIYHIGDPQGVQKEQSSSLNNAVRVIKQKLGGTYRPGPQRWMPRRDAIQSVLTKMTGGRGVVQVDRQRATEVWFALRGGWHYHKARTGVVAAEPKKNIHSHPADAMSYGAAILFPTGKVMVGSTVTPAAPGSYFGSPNEPGAWRIGPEGGRPPISHGATLPIAKPGDKW